MKLGFAETAFLAVIKEHYHMDYRCLAASRYTRFLGLSVHYTTIQKAITRLPQWFQAEAARVFAELVSSKTIEGVTDATEFSYDSFEVRVVGLEKKRVRRTVKLVGLWDADKRVFHDYRCLDGEEHEVKTLLPMVDSVRVELEKLFADCGFSSRENVQGLADRGVEPVIRPQESARPTKRLRYPAWGKLVKRYRELGYERWREETGYGKRFQNEGTFGALIARFGDAVRARTDKVASRLIGARIVLHNFFASLVRAA